MAVVIISKKFRFEASHVLPKHPGKCSRLHGHSWELTVRVKGPISQDDGFVCDFYDLSRIVEEHVVSKLDHTHLGYGTLKAPPYEGLGGFITVRQQFTPYFGEYHYPSSENLVVAIAHILKPLIKEIKKDGSVTLYEVKLSETCTSECSWRADEYVY